MPHHVGSLDAWLDSATTANIASALGGAHGLHSKHSQVYLFGGALRTASAGGDRGADASFEAAQHYSSCGSSPGNHLLSMSFHQSDGAQQPDSKQGALSLSGRLLACTSKRQSLLSVQLRSSSCSPDSLQDMNVNGSDGSENDDNGVDCHPAAASSAESPPLSLAVAADHASVPSVDTAPCEFGSIAAAAAVRSVTAPSLLLPTSATDVIGEAAPALGSKPLPMRSTSLVVAAQCDSAESDAVMFAGSADSSSGGFHSSGSNVLHFRDASAGELTLDTAAVAAAVSSIALAPGISLRAVVRAGTSPSSSSLPDIGRQGTRCDVVSLSTALSSPPRAANSLARYSSLDSVQGPATSGTHSMSPFHRLATGSSSTADSAALGLAALPGVLLDAEVSCSNTTTTTSSNLSAKCRDPGSCSPEQEGAQHCLVDTCSGSVETDPGRRGSTGRGVSYADLFSVQLVLPPEGDRRISGRASLDSRITSAIVERHAAALTANDGRCDTVDAASEFRVREGRCRHPRVHGGMHYLQHSLSLGGSPRSPAARDAAAAATACSEEPAAVRDGGNTGSLSGEVSPALYEGTVKRGFPRKAGPALARAVSQPIPAAMMGSLWD